MVVPRLRRFGEAVDDHQLLLGRRLHEAELVDLVEDPADLPAVVERPRGTAVVLRTHRRPARRAAGLPRILHGSCRSRSGAGMNRESAAPDAVRALLVRGLGWKAISQVMLQLSRVVVAVILARLLTPADYGIAAMVLVFSGLVYVFADLGLGAALIQRRELTRG